MLNIYVFTVSNYTQIKVVRTFTLKNLMEKLYNMQYKMP